MTPITKAAVALMTSPRHNAKKVLPYLSARVAVLQRLAAETVGIDTYSKPYPGHAALLKHISLQNGFFVECGGNDGFMVDPTYYLEKFRGWHGIIVEPLPKAAAACVRNRPHATVFEAALVPHDFTGSTIELQDCNAMSITTTTTYRADAWIAAGETAQNLTAVTRIVSARTLDSILEKNLPTADTTIDLLVIDVEGSEAAVLGGFSIGKYIPAYILIELHTEELKTAIEQILFPTYRLVERVDTADYLYTRI